LTAHGRLAQQLGIPAENVFVVENGTPVEFADGQARKLDRIPGGYVFIDGSGVGDIGPMVIRDREMLARDGFILLVMRRAPQGGLAGDPEIITRGFVYMKDSEDLIKTLAQVVREELKSLNGTTSDAALKEKAADALSKFVYGETRRRPMVIPVVV
jgi:ribonuclease J